MRNCTSRESVTGYGYNTGGISGSITSYGDSFIENCQAYGDVSSSLHQVGGIVGYIVSKGETAVDGCIAYGNCRGQHSVGGICGYAKCNDAACIVDIVNSIYAGREVEATGNNGSNGYTLATGLVGWLQVGTGKAHIVNCASRVQTVKTVGKAGGYPSANNTLSGILGFQNGSRRTLRTLLDHRQERLPDRRRTLDLHLLRRHLRQNPQRQLYDHLTQTLLFRPEHAGRSGNFESHQGGRSDRQVLRRDVDAAGRPQCRCRCPC